MPNWYSWLSRILFPQALQNRGRFRIPLLLDANLRQRRIGDLRVRIGAEHLDEIVGGPVQRLLAEDLHLEQHRLLPSGLLDERAVDRLHRDRGRVEILEPRVVRGERDGELRLGECSDTGCASALHELQRRRLVRLGGQRPVELQECLAQPRPGRRGLCQRPLEIRLEIRARIAAPAAPVSPAMHLFRALRRRIELGPQRGRVERQAALPRGQARSRWPDGQAGRPWRPSPPRNTRARQALDRRAAMRCRPRAADT